MFLSCFKGVELKMKKSEIKQWTKSIKIAIQNARENIDDILMPYNNVKTHLESIEEVENNFGIDCGIDYEYILGNTIASCIQDNENIEEINNQFDELLSNLEEWYEESSVSKQEEIQEQYVDVLNEIREMFEIDNIECEEDLDNQLFDMFNALDDMEI